MSRQTYELYDVGDDYNIEIARRNSDPYDCDLCEKYVLTTQPSIRISYDDGERNGGSIWICKHCVRDMLFRINLEEVMLLKDKICK